MARQRYYEDYRPSQAPLYAMALAMVGAAVAFGLWLYPDILASTAQAPAPKGAIGNQAPPQVRGSFAGVFTVQATPIPGIAQSQAEADKLYQEAIDKGNAASAPAAQPLPLNSAGEPVISQEQQAQQALSLQLAEQEGNAAADAQLAAQRASANADANSRAPDVSYEDAKAMLHRDPCSVPRADPHTCAQGLYKPTPVN